jgi:plastocyanin
MHSMGDVMQRPRAERHFTLRSAIFFVASFLAAPSLVSLPAPLRAENATVKIGDFAFSPSNMTVKVGTTVSWRNTDDIPHRVVSTTRRFKSLVLDTDDNFSFTFSEPGNYEYFRCTAHDGKDRRRAGE